MRIHTDFHTEDTIRAALDRCKADGLVHSDVQIDVLTRHGSRKRDCGYEVQMGAPSGTPTFLPEASREYLTGCLDLEGKALERVLKRGGKRFRRNGYGAQPADLPMGANWHEWGYFLAYLFDAEGTAICGPYDGWDALDWEGRGRSEHRTIAYPEHFDGRAADFLGTAWENARRRAAVSAA